MLLAYVDTDVVISALISAKGASRKLLTEISSVRLVISNSSQKEIAEVISRLKLKNMPFKMSVKKVNFQKFTAYTSFVLDRNDRHIISSTHQLKAKYLITHNNRHFKRGIILEKLGIIILSPGQFLQFLRSQINR